MTIKVTRPQIDLREEVNKALTAQTLEKQDATVKSLVAKGGLTAGGAAKASQYLLEAISHNKTDLSAVDVFVYDTNKDSDAGAWRKRTQYTSWYNETLNTSTRGSRKDFPAVAVIVAESNQITIYDGDDPNMPMWMVFETGSGTLPWTSTVTKVYFLNGLFCIGCDGREVEVNFISDDVTLRDATYWYAYLVSIKDRNDVPSLTPVLSTTTNIINSTVNDLAMTVLPNAPVDTATGLPVPTIAVATNGGISVIRDNGAVVDITNTQDSSTFNFCQNVQFRSDGGIVWSADSTGNSSAPRFVHVLHVIPTSNFVHTVVANPPNTDEFYARTTTSADAQFISTSGLQALQESAGTTNVGTTDGLSSFAYNKTDAAKGLTNHINTDYNTGWMNGDIKLATLSDTDDTNIIGGNKITNGDAWSGASSSQSSTAPTGWTGEGGATWSTEAGGDGSYIRLYNENNGGAGPNSYMHQTITTVVGKKYTISATQYHHATITVYVSAGTGAGVGNLLNISYNSSSGATPKEVQGTFTATGTTTYINLGIISGTHNYSVGWDNIVVTEAEEDRSVNGNGVQVFGTVTKTAVATGADLVSYSGWSATNYLQQTLDWTIGTDDFSFAFWAKPPASPGSYLHVISIGTEATGGQSSGSGIVLKLNAQPGSTPYFYTDAGGASQSTYDVNNILKATAWNQVVCGRDNGDFYIYINGKLAVTGANNAFNISDTVLMIGRGAGLNEFDPDTELALVRISKTTPSPDQIKKMYEDEKFLFQENAKATLYGTSNAVKAMAYDDVTDLLHVGTSAGRSDFHGLTRVDNTTDAISVAISASNEMVAED
ncbi:LamG domain-containing protein [bacterium]|nr:LamG domain-containing protein [bacterium]